MVQISALGAQTIGPTSGGKVTPFNNISTSPQQVIGPNSQRANIVFDNPGTVDVFVAPILQANGLALTVSTSLLGGTYIIFANGGSRSLSGEVQGGYQAFSRSGSGNFLTVTESNL